MMPIIRALVIHSNNAFESRLDFWVLKTWLYVQYETTASAGWILDNLAFPVGHPCHRDYLKYSRLRGYMGLKIKTPEVLPTCCYASRN